MSEQEIKELLQKLSDLEANISKNIEEYNRLANQADVGLRLALMGASIEKDDEEEDLTHNQIAEQRDYPPRPWIQAHGADYWFPSAICAGY